MYRPVSYPGVNVGVGGMNLNLPLPMSMRPYAPSMAYGAMQTNMPMEQAANQMQQGQMEWSGQFGFPPKEPDAGAAGVAAQQPPQQQSAGYPTPATANEAIGYEYYAYEYYKQQLAAATGVPLSVPSTGLPSSSVTGGGGSTAALTAVTASPAAAPTAAAIPTAPTTNATGMQQTTTFTDPYTGATIDPQQYAAYAAAVGMMTPQTHAQTPAYYPNAMFDYSQLLTPMVPPSPITSAQTPPNTGMAAFPLVVAPSPMGVAGGGWQGAISPARLHALAQQSKGFGSTGHGAGQIKDI